MTISTETGIDVLKLLLAVKLVYGAVHKRRRNFLGGSQITIFYDMRGQRKYDVVNFCITFFDFFKNFDMFAKIVLNLGILFRIHLAN